MTPEAYGQQLADEYLSGKKAIEVVGEINTTFPNRIERALAYTAFKSAMSSEIGPKVRAKRVQRTILTRREH